MTEYELTGYRPAESVEHVVRVLASYPWNHIDIGYPNPSAKTLCACKGPYFDIAEDLWRELSDLGVVSLVTGEIGVYRLADVLPARYALLRVQLQLGVE